MRHGQPRTARSRNAPQQQLPLGLQPFENPHPFTERHAVAVSAAAQDLYWYLASERQSIFFKRLANEPPPWSYDPIFEKFRFTNAYRASDRASQYLIRNVIYRCPESQDSEGIFFRIMLFKLFNKIETWQLLEASFSDISWQDYSFGRFDRVLSEAMAKGQRIYSSAYIMPSGPKAWGHAKKHQHHLELIERMIAAEVPQRLAQTCNMRQGFELLRSFPMIGDFLAYQLITDINYSELVDYDECEFVIAGPGALSGVAKCFPDSKYSAEEHIRLAAERQTEEFARRELPFRSLWGRPLQFIDCQNLFCEIDKYLRVSHPSLAGRFGRTRIKRSYSSASRPALEQVWYPPKWGINQRVEEFYDGLCGTSRASP